MKCGIAFGGNLGNVEDTFQRAIEQLNAQHIRITEFSQVSKSAPMGIDAGATFCNAAAVAETSLSPAAILQTLHDIERTLGRERTLRWGPRTIDLDLLFCDNATVASPGLVLPHPCLWFRRFVVEPLHEIAPDWNHPLLNESVRQMWKRLNERPICFVLGDCPFDDHQRRDFAKLIQSKYHPDVIRFDDGLAEANAAQRFATIVIQQADIDAVPSQPQNYQERIIEVRLSPDTGNDMSGQSMHDIITAALG